jgi:hypothetical protein
MGPVISAVDEYGDVRFAEGAASRQSEVDAAKAEAEAAHGKYLAVKAEYDEHMSEPH